MFYSGTKAVEDDFILSLSDAFISKGEESDLELKVQVLNIYKGHNKSLMQQCKRLDEYSIFIAKIDEGLAQGMGSQQAIENAINYCIAHNIMADILSKNRAEVIGMLLMESMSLSADEVMKALKLSDKEILHYKKIMQNQ